MEVEQSNNRKTNELKNNEKKYHLKESVKCVNWTLNEQSRICAFEGVIGAFFEVTP